MEAAAPAVSLSNLTLEQFRLAVKPARDESETLISLGKLQSGAIARRELADATANEMLLRMVNAVRADAAFGENSDLYRAMGYKTKAERKSGLTRKRQTAPDVNDAP